MKSMSSALSITLALILGIGLAVAGYKLVSPPQISKNGNLLEGQSQMKRLDQAPDFALKDLEGQTVKLTSLSGEKVYIKFWASWCSICLAGMEELESLAAEERGYKIITIVSPGQNGEQDTEAFKEWFAQLPYEHLTVLLDETGDVMKSYGVRAFPTSAFISSDGTLHKVTPGHTGNEAIEEIMSSIQ